MPINSLRKRTLDGNIETLLSLVLKQGPSYGYDIVQQLNERAPGLLDLGEGTVYPVLHRMEGKELLQSEWRQAENGRRRKYYRLTAKGRRALAEDLQQWAGLREVMGAFIEPDANLGTT